MGVVGEALLDERGRSGDPDAGQHIVGGDPASGRALGAGGHLATGQDGFEEVRQRGRVRQLNLVRPARPGRANQVDSPVSQSETGTPPATAVAATVNA